MATSLQMLGTLADARRRRRSGSRRTPARTFRRRPPCAADSCTRIRAAPRGTTGKLKAVTYTPCAASVGHPPASTASPNITGTIGCSPASRSNPSSVIRRRNSAAFSNSRSAARPSSPPGPVPSAWPRRWPAPASWRTGRGGPLPQHGHDFAAAGDVAAGGAAQGLAERAGEDVHPARHAGVFRGPGPVAPMKPTAWESSTITSASYFSARSQMSASGAR